MAVVIRVLPVVGIVLMSVGVSRCARPIVRTADDLAVLIVTVSDWRNGVVIRRESMSSAPFTIHRRPPLPRVVVPSTGSLGYHANASRPSAAPPVLFLLEESSSVYGHITVIPVPVREAEYREVQDALVRYVPTEQPPCVALSPFFIRGLGSAPREPVQLVAYAGDRRGLTVVDPGLHTLDLSPAMRLSARRVEQHGDVYTSVSIASAADDLIVFAVTEIRDGYRANMSLPSAKGNRNGWSSFPDDGDTSLYVIPNQPEVRSRCGAT